MKLIELINVLPQPAILVEDSWVQIYDHETEKKYLGGPSGEFLLDGENSGLNYLGFFTKEVTLIENMDNGCMNVYIK